MSKLTGLCVAIALLALTACSPDRTPTNANTSSATPQFATSDVPSVSPLLVEINDQLAASGAPYQVLKAEWFTDGSSSNAGQTVFASDHHYTIDVNWVPGDPRRGGRTNITYLVDQSDGSAIGRNPATGALFLVPNAVTEAAIDRSLTTWDTSTPCSNLPITKVPDTGADPDLIDAFVFGNPALLGTPFSADIVNAGWLPASFFERLVPGGSRFILGVTFTFVFGSSAGLTDIDGDGRFDVAWREIYYNRNFAWSTTDATRNIDIETVALHENGHGIDMDHFGKISLTQNGQLIVAPVAVMNAFYNGPLRDLQGNDTGKHCTLFGSWPNH